MNRQYTVHMDTIMSFSLHINSANTNTHIKTCPLQKSKTFWHLSFFFFLMASGFLFKKIGKYTTGLVLLVVESLWQSPCSVFTILGCWCTASVNEGVAPTIKQTFCLLLLLFFRQGLRLTSEGSPADLLVNCAITRSTNLSISCHISNVD